MKNLIPLLGSTPVMEANITGRKTETRRTVGLDKINEDPKDWKFLHTYSVTRKGGKTDHYVWFEHTNGETISIKCPYGGIGDVLWWREASFRADLGFIYKASENGKGLFKWKPGIHMPYDACRFWTENISVIPERLHSITEEGAKAEGIELLYAKNYRNYMFGKRWLMGEKVNHKTCSTPIYSYMSLWDSINGASAWDVNPWVWVIKYKPVQKPLNLFPKNHKGNGGANV